MKQVTRIGVYGVVVDDKDHILLVNKSGGCDIGKLDLPGGGIEFGESPLETLQREFIEEVGMVFEEVTILDNLSSLREIDVEGIPVHFHQLAQIYNVKKVSPHPDLKALDLFGWHSIHSLCLDCLTPFAKAVVEKMQKKFIKVAL